MTSLETKKEDDINIEKNRPIEGFNSNEISKDDITIKNESKVLILPKSEKEIAYYKEKDLFDEEVKDNEVNISQDQMDILENENKYATK